MSTLLYHALGRSAADHSPFDKAALAVAQSGAPLIVSPYIGVGYLQRLTGASEGWRLISDVEAWLSSLNLSSRAAAWLFIRENLERIHHCPAIHAKVVIGGDRAMLGSANLTSTGILGRTEMGILLDEPTLVDELRAWFEGLWSQTRAPTVDEASAYVGLLDEEARRSPMRRQKASLSSATRQVRAKLVALAPTAVPVVLEGSPLDLGTVARELVVRDSVRYGSLADEVRSVIDELAAAGFRLRDVVARVSGGSVREVYFLLLQQCANHPRSVFTEGTVNRLVVEGGQFIQSTQERLAPALAPFETFLEVLLNRLSFDEPRLLPREAELEQATGFSGWLQVVLVAELLDWGFLLLVDIPGSLPLYQLADDFDWEGRGRFFSGVARRWQARRTQRAGTPSRASAVGASGFDPDWDEPEEAKAPTEPPVPDTATLRQMGLALNALDEIRRVGSEQQRAVLDVALAKTIRWLGEHPDEVASLKSKSLPGLLAGRVGLGKRQLAAVLDGSKCPRFWALTAAAGSEMRHLRLSNSGNSEKWRLYPLAKTAWDEAQAARAALWPVVKEPTDGSCPDTLTTA